ncbi:transcriptional regulator domain-containing protein [Novosphingobium sp. Gsoil 351]|uniref:transcriptional regulator domain-containing protein n=1 Tax=Novosphingobium sp. Gsoil 351 TaxID=2675225 RepID=UPI00351B71F8
MGAIQIYSSNILVISPARRRGAGSGRHSVDAWTSLELPNWRNSSAYSWLTGADRASLMWEWLRRDETYLAWHIKATAATGGGVLPTAAEARHWGVHFRGGSDDLGPRCPDHLERRSRPRCAHGGCSRGRAQRSRCARPGRVAAVVERRG